MYKDLSLMEKADWIHKAVLNGFTNQKDIEWAYDLLHLDDLKQSNDSDYLSIMERVARENNPIWNKDRIQHGELPLTEELELIRILNDNSYDYNGYYNKYPNDSSNADTHWTDEFKTVYHPTFSIESRYSGVVDSNYNPEGRIGGYWNGDNFVPANWLNKKQIGGKIESLRQPYYGYWPGLYDLYINKDSGYYYKPQGSFGGGKSGGSGVSFKWDEYSEVPQQDKIDYLLVPIERSFSDAFAQARKAGLSDFIFNGKRYTTEMSSNPVYTKAEYESIPGTLKLVKDFEGNVYPDSTRYYPTQAIYGEFERNENPNVFKSGGHSIHIKPENRGKFTRLKERTGHSASWFKAHGTPALKKMATFALNARKWKHDNGGHLFLGNGSSWLSKFGMNVAMAENPAFMLAVGWQLDNNGIYHQDPTNEGSKRLAESLYDIGLNAAFDVFGSPILDKVIKLGVRAAKSLKNAKAAKNIPSGKLPSVTINNTVPEQLPMTNETPPRFVEYNPQSLFENFSLDDVRDRINITDIRNENIPQDEWSLLMNRLLLALERLNILPAEEIIHNLDLIYNTTPAERIIDDLNELIIENTPRSKTQRVIDGWNKIRPTVKIDSQGIPHKVFRDPEMFARRAEGDINHAFYAYLSPENAMKKMNADFAQIPSKGRAELIGHNALSTDSWPWGITLSARKHGVEGTLKPVVKRGKPVYLELNTMGREVLKGKKLTPAEQLERLNKTIDLVNKTTGLKFPHGFIEKTDYFDKIFMPAWSFLKFNNGGYLIQDNNGYYTNSKDNDMLITGNNRGTNITMKGIPFEVDAWDNFGNYQRLEPNGEYWFPGSQVREHALQNGGYKTNIKYEHMFPMPLLEDYATTALLLNARAGLPNPMNYNVRYKTLDFIAPYLQDMVDKHPKNVSFLPNFMLKYVNYNTRPLTVINANSIEKPLNITEINPDLDKYRSLDDYVKQDKLDYMTTVWNYLADKQINPFNAAAIMGNIMLESGFNPLAKNPKSSAYGLLQMIDSLRNKANKWINANKLDKDLGQIDWYLHLMNDNIDEYMDEYNNFLSRWDAVKQQYDKNPSNRNLKTLNDFQDYYDNVYKYRVDNNQMYSVDSLNKVFNNPNSSLRDKTEMFENVFMKAGNGSEHQKRYDYAKDIYNYFTNKKLLGGVIKPFSYKPLPVVRY